MVSQVGVQIKGRRLGDDGRGGPAQCGSAMVAINWDEVTCLENVGERHD